MLEIASGMVLGAAPGADLRTPTHGESPLAALDRVILPALLRPPCLVSFSGGMDSSFVLAVATITARRHGLPAPIPVSWHFVDAPLAGESGWQQRVLVELGLVDRLVLQAGDDLDFVGPVASRMLHQHGVLYPANLHLHVPLLEQATGGSLLTGLGGDQALSSWAGGRRTLLSRVRRVLPVELRMWLRRHRGYEPGSWLHRDVSRALLRRRLLEAKVRPASPFERLQWRMCRRSLVMAAQNLQAIGAEHAVGVVNPLLDRGFHAALGRMVSAPGPLSRAQLLSMAAGDDLPSVAWEYRPKATFAQVFLRHHTQVFLQNWRGVGIPESLVDATALRAEWSTWPIATTSATLLQSLWLSQQ